MTLFRIAHASDLHLGRKASWLNPIQAAGFSRKAFGAMWSVLKMEERGLVARATYPSTFNPDAANRLLANINQLAPSIDALVLTGDLATTGEHEDLALALDYLDGRPNRLWRPTHTDSIFQHSAMKVIALPGNHDRYGGDLREPISTKFENYFGEHWDFNQGHSRGLIGESATKRVRYSTFQDSHNILLIVSADFSLTSTKQATTTFGHFGQGIVARRVLDELVHTTATIRNFKNLNVFVVWAIHFAPSHPGGNIDLELLDSKLLVDEASNNSVDLILCGHTHLQQSYSAVCSRGRHVPIVCSGPSCGVGPENAYGFSLVDITMSNNGNSYLTTPMVWNGQDFVPD